MKLARTRWNIVSASTLAFAAFFMLVFIGILGVGFYDSVVTLEHDMTQLASRIESSFPSRSPNNAEKAASLVAPMLANHALLVTFIGDRRRVTIRFEKGDKPQQLPAIFIRDRADRSAEPEAEDFIGRCISGFATIFGLQIERGHIGSLDFYITDNARIFTDVYRHYIPLVIFACCIMLLGSIIFGSWINRQMLRPLTDVTAALERLANGDLTLQSVSETERSPLNALSVSFNGAVAQVKQAFELRDEADAAMRQFISDAGHQLRTPLTVIRGFLSIVEQNQGLVSSENMFIQTMHQQVNVMSSLIDNLILLDTWDRRDENLDKTLIDVRQFVADIVGTFAGAFADRDIAFDGSGEQELLVLVNPYELHHALANILDNAIKYACDPLRITLARNESVVKISFIDHGPGMSTSFAARAFDRFARGDRRDIEGSGLGLSIARRALERARGSISLVTEPGVGTTFVIRLPLFSEPVAICR